MTLTIKRVHKLAQPYDTWFVNTHIMLVRIKYLPNNQSKVTLTTSLFFDTTPNEILAFLRQFVLYVHKHTYTRIASYISKECLYNNTKLWISISISTIIRSTGRSAQFT